jgi:hypothetical protein
VLGDMSAAGLLNVYALAEPLVQQNSKEFRTTIQVGWLGMLVLLGCLQTASWHAGSVRRAASHRAE